MVQVPGGDAAQPRPAGPRGRPPSSLRGGSPRGLASGPVEGRATPRRRAPEESVAKRRRIEARAPPGRPAAEAIRSIGARGPAHRHRRGVPGGARAATFARRLAPAGRALRGFRLQAPGTSGPAAGSSAHPRGPHHRRGPAAALRHRPATLGPAPVASTAVPERPCADDRTGALDGGRPVLDPPGVGGHRRGEREPARRVAGRVPTHDDGATTPPAPGRELDRGDLQMDTFENPIMGAGRPEFRAWSVRFGGRWALRRVRGGLFQAQLGPRWGQAGAGRPLSQRHRVML